METLPSEIILHIAAFLEPHELVKLQLVCRRLLTIARDNNLWRIQCFEKSPWETVRRRREFIANGTTRGSFSLDFLRASNSSGSQEINNVLGSTIRRSRTDAGEKARILANWDPSYPGENIDWYSEFIHRSAPITVSWLQQPRKRENPEHEPVEVRGIGVYNCPGDDNSSIALAPLDDGSVCLWDLSGSFGMKGGMIGRSQQGILCSTEPKALRAKMISTGVVECVSINNERKRAYIAVQSEVDIETLKVISQETFPFSISALSETRHSTPVTVGTNLSLHLYDSRANHRHTTDSTGQIDFHHTSTSIRSKNPIHVPPQLPASQNFLNPQPVNYAPLFHPGPLSIIHVPTSGDNWDTSSEIYVAGRFPSILNYDRRYFPKLCGTIYSGARLCSMASIPYPFSAPENDRMRRGVMSIAQVEDVKSPSGATLIACGEYNSKGSLELYGLSPKSSDSCGSKPPGPNSNFMRNRQTSSNSKLLSVSIHGTRVVFSDGGGNLKWVERDGLTEVRQWHVRDSSPEPLREVSGHTGSMFIDSGSGEIVRKIMRASTDRVKKAPNNDDLVLWTGEKLGLLGFSNKPGFTADGFDEVVKTADEESKEREERVYRDTMGRALQRQVSEVRFLGGLELGTRRGDL